MPERSATAARLRRWADARERRNTPGGHGKEGTALLREAAALLERDEPETRNLVDDATLAYNREDGRIGVYSFHAPIAPGLTGTALTVAAVRIGDHAHVHVESGNVVPSDGRPRVTRGFAGKLILRWHEWLLLRDVLASHDHIHVAEVENPRPGQAGYYAKDRP